MKHRFITLSLVVFLSFGLAEVVNAQWGTSDLKLSKAIAHACEGLLVGYARNPSLEETLTGIYEAHVEEVMMQSNSFYIAFDSTEAKGIISRALIISNARNPSLTEELDAFADMCREDIDAL